MAQFGELDVRLESWDVDPSPHSNAASSQLMSLRVISWNVDYHVPVMVTLDLASHSRRA